MYESLQSLRFIESKLAPFLAIYCSHRTVLSKLVHINTSLLSNGAISQEQFYANTGTIDSLQESIAAYDRSTDFMLGRIRSTSQLISDTIALKSQNTSEVLSDQMLQHSGTIRVITLVTLVYLPATFVAVIVKCCLRCGFRLTTLGIFWHGFLLGKRYGLWQQLDHLTICRSLFCSSGAFNCPNSSILEVERTASTYGSPTRGDEFCSCINLN